MTTGMSDFMSRSGRNWPRPEIPIPDLAVPYAAPTATRYGREDSAREDEGCQGAATGEREG